MGYVIPDKSKQEKAVLIGLVIQGQPEAQVKDHLNELEFLAFTANAIIAKRFVQKLYAPNPKTFLGTGKIAEVKDYVLKQKVDMVIFDDELSATQLRNIEKYLNKNPERPNCKILDRNNLILDIFASRARTSHAKTQVELAQYQYLLPRLTRMWTHLERQKGGIGLRGPGETELETDRRIIREKIKRLKNKLKSIDKQMITQRKSRASLIRVALVGYTNAGKSTIMNSLSKTDVLAEDKLFATLDTTVRKITVKNLPFLLSDTVGFIRKLPHQLIESFKSTLAEVEEADVLVHVIDLSHPSFEDQILIANNTLMEIGASEIPTILVFNKLDKFSDKLNKQQLRKTWMAKLTAHGNSNVRACLFISALETDGIKDLKNQLYNTVKPLYMKRYPYNNLLY
ncbi:GTPase HflX [Flavobacteriales bacterium AH-315-E23]|nr:GTPase HflX [Flavobacteriales bacterium AH-315-E23]